MENSRKWYELDNAAKIVPSTTQGTDTRVFRISVELTEEVDGATLQRAVDRTLLEFPYFNSILKRGMFWYYLEASELRPVVEQEHLPACCAIYAEGRRNLLYRVLFYRRRISLEMFHVLTDGTGAFEFLKVILTNYLKLRHDISDEAVGPMNISSSQEKESDAFDQYYEKKRGRAEAAKTAPKRAYHLHGYRDENLRVHLIEGTVSTRAFIGYCHKLGATVAEVTTALYMESMIREMTTREKDLPIVLSVPVNLRNYFASSTTRNFFGVINVVFYPKDYDGTLGSIIQKVRESFESQLKEDQVSLTMNSYSSLEKNLAVKVVPLPIKNFVIRRANAMVQRGITGTVSNVGKVTMPQVLCPYIDRFVCFMAAPDAQICLSSFQDKMCFGIASAFEEHPVLMHFFRALSDEGMEVELSSNDYDAPVHRSSAVERVSRMIREGGK